RNGVWTRCATSEGFAKIPAPTMPPMTIIVASNNPSSRRGLVAVVIPSGVKFCRASVSAPNAFGVPETHYSSSRGTELVNSKFWRRLYERRVLSEILCKFRIVSQPPQSIGGENKVCGAASPQLFQAQNYFLAVARSTSVNAVFFQEIPAFALSIIKYRWVAHV